MVVSYVCSNKKIRLQAMKVDPRLKREKESMQAGSVLGQRVFLPSLRYNKEIRGFPFRFLHPLC